MAEKISRVQNTIAPAIPDPVMPPLWALGDNFSKDDEPVIIEFKGGATKKPPSVFDLDLTVYRPVSKKPNNPPAYVEDNEEDYDNARLEELIEEMIGQTYSITYCDADGSYTNREITVNGISHYGRAVYIDAYCHLRDDDREFKVSRIVGSLINIRTGEGIDPDDLK